MLAFETPRLTPAWRGRVVCPRCRGDLEAAPPGVRCMGSCACAYEASPDGIVHLLDRTAAEDSHRRYATDHPPRAEGATASRAAAFVRRHPWLLGPPIAWESKKAARWRALAAQFDRPDMASVNLGSAGQRLWPSQLCVDLVPTPGVDLCCDVHALPFADDSLDCVMATSLLEHLEAPARCAAEVARCLRPGGELYVEVPWLYEVHAYPLDFQRWTLAGLRALFRGMEVVGQGPCEGPACTLARVTRGFVASLFRNRVLYYGARTAMTWLLFWCKYLDALVPEENRAAFAMGFWFRARKP